MCGTTPRRAAWHGSEGGDLWEVLARLEDAGCARYVVTDVTKDGTPSRARPRAAARSDGPHLATGRGFGRISNLDDIAALRELVPLGLEGAIVGKRPVRGRIHADRGAGLSPARDSAGVPFEGQSFHENPGRGR